MQCSNHGASCSLLVTSIECVHVGKSLRLKGVMKGLVKEVVRRVQRSGHGVLEKEGRVVEIDATLELIFMTHATCNEVDVMKSEIPEILNRLYEVSVPEDHSLIQDLCSISISNQPRGIRPLMTRVLCSIVLHSSPKVINSAPYSRIALVQFLKSCLNFEDLVDKEVNGYTAELLNAVIQSMKSASSLDAFVQDGGGAVFLDMIQRSDKSIRNILWESLLLFIQNSEPFAIEASKSSITISIAGLLRDAFLKADAHAVGLTRMGSIVNALLFSSVKFRDALADSIREVLFLDTIQDSLLHVEEQIILSTTRKIRILLLPVITNQAFLQEIVKFLLGDVDIQLPEAHDGEYHLRSCLIRRLDKISENVSLETLKLFSVLLELCQPLCLENLIMRNIRQFSWKTVDDVSAHLYSALPDVFDIPFSIRNEDTHDHLESSINLIWGTRTRMEFITSNTWISGSGDKKSYEDFNEGLFLKTLFLKLAMFMENSFEFNLELMHVFSLMFSMNNEILLRFFMTDSPMLKNSSKLLFNLEQIWNNALKQSSKMGNYETRLQNMTSHLKNDKMLIVETRDGRLFLQGVIVFKEFIKRITSIYNSHDVLNKLEL